MAQGEMNRNHRKAMASQRCYQTNQYATKVVIDTIKKMMQENFATYQKTGRKSVLRITASDIVERIMKHRVAGTSITREGNSQLPIGAYSDGNTIKENLNTNPHIGVQYSKVHISKLAENFIKGSKALDKYYEKTSGYFGQGFSESIKIFRMDSYSLIKESQYEKLKDLQRRYKARNASTADH